MKREYASNVRKAKAAALKAAASGELDSGQMLFGRRCSREIESVCRVDVRIVFYDFFGETVRLTGSRRSGPLWCGRPASKFEEEWERGM